MNENKENNEHNMTADQAATKQEPVNGKGDATSEEQSSTDDGEKISSAERDLKAMENLKEVIAQTVSEGEHINLSKVTLSKILGADIFNTQFMKNQIYLFLLIAAFVIVYISNRYTVQKDLIEIDKLHEELQDAKYRALSSSSDITEKSRESNVLEVLKNNKDSVLKIASQPPYIINVPDEQ
ncbi:FtsL-like putative cell division protein [Prevotella sp. AGR2160]|uniref:FtsL-like putative cell division protein n=1 Tax=Prevotella sp. AGR2160 TaxID=1280674 RepID=UPI000425D952